MTDRNPDYPSLYTVPMRAAPIPSPAERKQALADEQKAVERLQVDQRAGHSADEQDQYDRPKGGPQTPNDTLRQFARGGDRQRRWNRCGQSTSHEHDQHLDAGRSKEPQDATGRQQDQGRRQFGTASHFTAISRFASMSFGGR